MAEGWARALKDEIMDVWSAGIETHGLNPLAVKAMAAVGVDISRHRSKHVDELQAVEFDLVITVCDNARESCPLFPGTATVVHHSFPDPPWLARDASTEEEALVHYVKVRDQIQEFVAGLPESVAVS